MNAALFPYKETANIAITIAININIVWKRGYIDSIGRVPVQGDGTR